MKKVERLFPFSIYNGNTYKFSILKLLFEFPLFASVELFFLKTGMQCISLNENSEASFNIF